MFFGGDSGVAESCVVDLESSAGGGNHLMVPRGLVEEPEKKVVEAKGGSPDHASEGKFSLSDDSGCGRPVSGRGFGRGFSRRIEG